MYAEPMKMVVKAKPRGSSPPCRHSAVIMIACRRPPARLLALVASVSGRAQEVSRLRPTAAISLNEAQWLAQMPTDQASAHCQPTKQAATVPTQVEEIRRGNRLRMDAA